MKNPKVQTFTVHVTVTQNITAVVNAKDFADAWEKAKKLSVDDALDAPGKLQDDNIEITALLKD